jgi:hypothetical protein
MKSQSGFPWWEMCILAVVFVAVIILLCPELLDKVWPRGRPNVGVSLMQLDGLVAAIDLYRSDFGAYPPDAAMDPRFDSGSECIVYYLGSAFRVKPDVTKGEVLADRDAGPFFGFTPRDVSSKYLVDRDGDGNLEFVDAWGNPYLYDNVRDDSKGYTDCGTGSDPRMGSPWNSGSYDVWSQGSPRTGVPLKPRAKPRVPAQGLTPRPNDAESGGKDRGDGGAGETKGKPGGPDAPR